MRAWLCGNWTIVNRGGVPGAEPRLVAPRIEPDLTDPAALGYLLDGFGDGEDCLLPFEDVDLTDAEVSSHADRGGGGAGADVDAASSGSSRL